MREWPSRRNSRDIEPGRNRFATETRRPIATILRRCPAKRNARVPSLEPEREVSFGTSFESVQQLLNGFEVFGRGLSRGQRLHHQCFHRPAECPVDEVFQN